MEDLRKTKAQLVDELAALRARVAELEAAVEDLTLGAGAEQRQAAEEYRIAWEMASIGKALAAPDGTLLRVNEAFCRMLGRTRAELIGANAVSLAYPDDVAPAREFIARLASGELDQGTLEARYVRPDGQVVWAEVTSALIRHADGTPRYLINHVNDITARRRAQEALISAHERVRRFVDADTVGVVIASASGEITEANDCYLRMVGYTRAELSQGLVDWRAITPPEWLPADEQAIAELRERGACTPYEKEYVRRDGTRVAVLLSDVMLPGPEQQIAAFAIDVTERKRAEEALRAMSARTEALLAAVPDIVMETDANKVYTWANAPGLAFYGEDCLGKPAAHYFVGEQDTYEIVEPVFAGSQEVVYVESWQRRRDGEARLLAWWCRSLRDADGRVVGGLSTARDITEQRQAAEALAESEARYRHLVETTSDWVWEVDTNGVYTYASPQVRDILGYEPEEVVGRTVLDLVPPEEAERIEPIMRDIAARGEAFRGLENTNLHADGHVVRMETSGIPIADASGVLRGYRGMDRDITEQKRAEEELRESEERLRAIFETSPDGIVLIEPATLRLLAFNDAACRQLGYTSEEFAEIRIPDIDVGLSAEELRDGVDEIAAGARWDSETRQQTKSGEVRDVLVTSKRLVLGDRVVLHAVWRDITDQKRAEEELRSSEERLRAIFDASPTGIVLVEPETLRMLEFNDTACRQLGYTREEFARLRIPDVEASESAEESRERVHRILGGGSHGFATRHRTKGGEVRDVMVTTDRIVVGGRTLALAVLQDITEQKRAEEELRASEERLRAIFETSPFGIVLVEPGTLRLLQFNDTACRQLGYTREEFARLRIPDVEAVETPEESVARVDDIAAGTRHEFETRHRTKTGEVRDVLVISTQLVLRGTALAHAVWLDITEQKRAERALQERERLLQETGLAARVGGWEHDLITRQAVWTDTLRDVLEFEGPLPGPDEHLSYYEPESRRMLAEAYSRAEAEGIPFDLELRLHNARGRAMWARVTGNAVVLDGKCVRMWGIFQDITEQKRAERDQARLLALNQATVETVPSALLVLDERLDIVMANRQHVPGQEGAVGELAGRNLVDVFPPELLAEQNLLQRVRAVAAGGAPDALFAVQRDSPDLSRQFLDVRISGFATEEEGGQPSRRILLAIDDVTQQHTLEEQVRQTSKLEAVGTLAGGVAHDFNNILTGIIGYADIMAMEGLAPEGASELRTIRDLADRAADLTRQLLAFGRRQPLHMRVVNINELVENLTRMLERIIGEDVRHALRLAPDLGNVRADPGQIEQVLMNLAVNARDAMPYGGTLTIETMNATFGQTSAADHAGAPPGEYVMLSVSDTGRGMDEATRARAFEPFFTTKKVGEGTGLGLATVYGIVQQHGGHIWVDSEPDLGTTFRICLPRVRDEAEAVDEGGSAEQDVDGAETILLVEDDPSVLRVAQRALESRGYRVLPVPDPAGAARVLDEHQGEVALVLTDVVMPGVLGPELFAQLQARQPSLRVLYMSGYTRDAAGDDGSLELDAPFLHKPFTPTVLAAKVREVLDQ